MIAAHAFTTRTQDAGAGRSLWSKRALSAQQVQDSQRYTKKPWGEVNCDDCAESYELIKPCNVSSCPVTRDETRRHCIWMAQWLTRGIKWGLKQDGLFFFFLKQW